VAHTCYSIVLRPLVSASRRNRQEIAVRRRGEALAHEHVGGVMLAASSRGSSPRLTVAKAGNIIVEVGEMLASISCRNGITLAYSRHPPAARRSPASRERVNVVRAVSAVASSRHQNSSVRRVVAEMACRQRGAAAS